MLTPTLSASELRYRRLFEAAHDGILVLDPGSGQIIDVNPRLMNLLGYTYDELIGKQLFEIGLFKDESACRESFQELRMAGYIRYDALALETKDGQRVQVEFVSNLYQEGDQTVIQCSLRDISARREAEGALQDATQELSRHAAELENLVSLRTSELKLSNTQLETFVYSIAHDLRAPLRTMQGFSEILVQEHAKHLDEQGREFANYINAAAQTMDRLLTDLLAFSQISQQKLELTPVDLEAVVISAVSGCDAQIQQTHAVVDCPAPWPMVRGHATTLRQVLLNLISNAIKFVSGKTPHVKVSAEPRPGGLVRIWVEDNGIGIPPEFQEKIFQVFQRLHTVEFAGTGIGLAIVQKGMERMGGSVGLISVPNEGSRFWVELRQSKSGP
jgi:PAS domain S-box-containing protein